jgi:uncharacterized protein YbjT (DUF2867 family)
MITVFGASGNTGGRAAAHLLEQGKQVRVVGRNRDKLAKLVAAGAQAAVGDLEDAGFVRQALTGAEGAYLLIPPKMTAPDFPGYQRRVVDHLLAGVEAAGVRYVVLLSSIGAHHAQGTGPIVGLHNFEARLRTISPLNALFVRAGFFMENAFMGLPQIKAAGVYGSPMPEPVAVPMIAAGDIGAYAGRRLAQLDFTGKAAVHLLGPKAVSQGEVAGALGRAIGKPVRHVQVSPEDMEKGMLQAGFSPSVVATFMEMSRASAQGLVAPEPGEPIEHAPTTFETWAKTVFAPVYAS